MRQTFALSTNLIGIYVLLNRQTENLCQVNGKKKLHSLFESHGVIRFEVYLSENDFSSNNINIINR